MKTIIKSNIRDYEVFFEENFEFLNKFKNIDFSVFIIDKKVFSLYKSYFNFIPKDDLFLFEAIEENKAFDKIHEIYDFIVSKEVKKNLSIISIGGGITQDITGFITSTIYRGVKWYFVPTTFLAMTDSCIGGKTSINYGSYKNLIGTFYPPNEIYINTQFLDTLEKLDFFSGIGETIKFQLMKEKYPKNFNQVAKIIDDVIKSESRLDIIHDNMNVKLSYMKDDEFDTGRRNLLNYGHCYGHSLESVSNYYVPHGIAVNIGMIFANLLSQKRGYYKNNLDFLNKEVLLKNIPLNLRIVDFDEIKILKGMKNDKKRIGKFLTVIVPDEEFKMIKVDDVTDEEFFTINQELKKLLF